MPVMIADDIRKLAWALGPGGEASALRLVGPGGNINGTDGVVAGTGVSLLNEYDLYLHQSVITLTSLAITITDTGGASGGYGSQKIYDYPAGLILVLGARTNLTMTAAAGITATGTVKHALGTVAVSSSDTLSSTLANILPSTSTTLASSAGTGLGAATASLYSDGTVTPVDVYLNIGIPDASISAGSTVTLSGTITITWVNLGTL